jgi:predicted transcriptional regulator
MSTDIAALLVSLKPRFAEMILAGEKTVELRRVRPSIEPGALVVFYASSPVKGVLGTGRVAAIDTSSPSALWERHGSLSGLSRREFSAYFAGSDEAVAIALTDVRRLSKPVPLAELRRRWQGFRPPQSFRYLDAAQAANVM